ncbi:hypothetical protein FRC12_024064 [Ceratobasidium sp. 428]|nr:hypothetical protein FRC12_024064 [Ceratobasidium sp. 428]
MDIDTPPQYTAEQAQTATFAQVATKVTKFIDRPDILGETLEAFRSFLTSIENVTLLKNQLQTLKVQGVSVIEEAANYLKEGGDLANILPRLSIIFTTVARHLESSTKWEVVLQAQGGLEQLYAVIDSACDGLDQVHTSISHMRDNLGSASKKNELLIARNKDREKIAELQAVFEQTSQTDSLTTRAQQSINKNLKIIGDPTVAQPHQDAKRALAVVAELTGQSLPASTVLGKEFVTIGQHAIHQGTSYDIYEGEYFTGEKIAIKKLRHRVDELTARKTHERFARQALNWSMLRHDAILTFYGMGVEPAPTAPEEFQMYMVSPFLQNRDAKTYLTKYNEVPPQSRLQIIFDVARGLKYLHEDVDLGQGVHGIVHSGLDINNVLIKDSGRAVISGFSHTKKIIAGDLQESFTGDNTNYRYMGPELMQDEPQVTFGTDIYSWAMTSLEILTDIPPFGIKTRGPKIIQLVASGQTPKRGDHPKIEEYPHSNELWALFEQCWNPKPQERPSADTLTQHLKPMIQQLGKKSDPAVQHTQPSGKGPAPVESAPAMKPIIRSPTPPPNPQNPPPPAA